MQRFRYALDPALDAARAAERSAALAFAATRRAVAESEADLSALVARARAIAESAAQCVPPAPGTLAVSELIDREQCLAVLALRRMRAVEALVSAVATSSRLRTEYEARVRRRRAFEAHRERALETYRFACDLAESSERDEGNAAAAVRETAREHQHDADPPASRGEPSARCHEARAPATGSEGA